MDKKKFRLKFMFQEIDLLPGQFVVGRSPSCNLTLEDPLVSRQHARMTITRQAVKIEDMGSRNGTMVNGEPLFDSVPLHNKDRIRIGSHDMVFLEESRFPSRPLKPTGAMISCPSCRIPFAAGASNCPHCSAPIVPDGTCKKCKKQLEPSDAFCARCGTTIERAQDTTIPVEMGGGSAGWTSTLVNEVIEKAIKANRLDHAASLLDGKIEDFELKSKRGAVDLAALVEITAYNTVLGIQKQEAERLDWILDRWMNMSLAMPADSLEEINDGVGDWYPLNDKLGKYLKILNEKKEISENEQLFITRLEELVGGNGSR